MLQSSYQQTLSYSQTQTQQQSLIITDSAAKRLKELQKDLNKEELYLRVIVESGGCSGFQYKFELANDVRNDDKVFEKLGKKFIIDDLSFTFLQGSTIDFEDSLMRQSFVVNDNPNSTTGCGCGTSFAVKE